MEAKLKNIFKYVFASFFLLAIHYSTKNFGGYGLYLENNIFGWIIVSILIGLGFLHIYHTRNINYSLFQIYVFLGILFFIPPLFYHNNELARYSIYRLTFILGGWLFLSSLFQFNFTKIEKNDFLFIIVISSLIQSIIGIIQYYGIGPTESFLFAKKQLPYGSFQQRNVMASYLATNIGVSLFLMDQSNSVFLKKIKHIVLYTSTFLCSILIIALQSTTGLVGLFLTSIFQIHRVDMRKKVYQYFFFSLIIGLLVGIYSNRILTDFDLKDKRTSDSRYWSGQIRLDLYDLTFDMWKENPISGIGYSKFPQVFREFISEKTKKNEMPHPFLLYKYYDHPHNEILYWLCEGGISPIVGILIIMGCFIKVLLKMKWGNVFPLIGLILPIFIHTQLEFPFKISLAHWIVFLFLIYFSCRKSMLAYKIKMRWPVLILSSFIPIIFSSYMVTTIQKLKTLKSFELDGLKDFELLSTIKSPGPLFLKYENYVLKTLYDIGTKTNDEKALKLFLDKAFTFIKYSPNQHIYKNIFFTYLLLNEMDKAKSWIIKTSELFPYLSEELQWIYFGLKRFDEEEIAQKCLHLISIRDPELHQKLSNYVFEK